MNTQTSTGPVIDEGDLTPELIERVSKLSRGGLIKLSALIDTNLGDAESIDTGAPPQPSRAEIQRRLNAVLDGTSETYTVEETSAYLRSRAWREGQS